MTDWLMDCWEILGRRDASSSPGLRLSQFSRDGFMFVSSSIDFATIGGGCVRPADCGAGNGSGFWCKCIGVSSLVER